MRDNKISWRGAISKTKPEKSPLESDNAGKKLKNTGLE